MPSSCARVSKLRKHKSEVITVLLPLVLPHRRSGQGTTSDTFDLLKTLCRANNFLDLSVSPQALDPLDHVVQIPSTTVMSSCCVICDVFASTSDEAVSLSLEIFC